MMLTARKDKRERKPRTISAGPGRPPFFPIATVLRKDRLLLQWHEGDVSRWEILDLNEASIFLGLSMGCILKKAKSGDFPQPVLVNGRNFLKAGWFYKDLIAHKTTYIDPIRDLRRGPDSAKAGSDQGSVVNGYPSTPLLREDSGHSSQVWNAGSEHQGTLTPQDRTNGRRQSETERPETLYDEFVRDIQVPGRYGDGRGGGGLSLLVKPTKIDGLLSKTFSQRVFINGRETNIGLGSYPGVTLEEARRRAKKNRQAIKQGRDPRINATLTFGEAEAKMLEGRVKGLGPESDSPAEWAASFRLHVDPLIRDLNVDEISRQDIMACLEPIWFTQRVTAKKLLQRIRAVMRWAIAHGYIDSDPTEYVQDGLGPNPSRPNHRESLPPDEVRPAIKVIEGSGSGWAVKAAAKFLILTGIKNKEVRGLMWDEIDYVKGILSIPGSRRKNRQDLDLPLGWAAFVVLDEALDRTGGVGLVFPSPRKDQMLSGGALGYVLRANRIACTPHGFRTSLKVFGKEEGWSDDIGEAALGHALPPQVRAYLRQHPPELRRSFMDAWATYVGFYSPPLLTRLACPLPTYGTNLFKEADSSMSNELGE